MNITGSTRVTGLIGYPVAHSLSPAMHNAAFAHLGLDYCYVPFPVRPGDVEQALGGTRALHIRGVNVTVPHKEQVAPHLDEVTTEARDIGAVNTICNEGGRLVGHNTDAAGFMRALAEEGIDVRRMRVLVLGAGGAARAVAYPLSREALSLSIYNRSRERAESLSACLGRFSGKIHVMTPEQMAEEGLREVDLIVNATSLGLKRDDPLPVDPLLIGEQHLVCDLIYHETALLREARQAGCRTVDGLGMLLWQGAYAFELWTGVGAPVDVMREALREARDHREHLAGDRLQGGG